MTTAWDDWLDVFDAEMLADVVPDDRLPDARRRLWDCAGLLDVVLLLYEVGFDFGPVAIELTWHRATVDELM